MSTMITAASPPAPFRTRGSTPCRRCGCCILRYAGRDLCNDCYVAAHGPALPAGAAYTWSRLWVACLLCNATGHAYAGKGLCVACRSLVAEQRRLPEEDVPQVFTQTLVALSRKHRARARAAWAVTGGIVNHYGLALEDLFAYGRTCELVQPRRLYAYLLHNDAGLTYDDVAWLLRRDHATAQHLARSVERDLACLPLVQRDELRRTLAALRALVARARATYTARQVQRMGGGAAC